MSEVESQTPIACNPQALSPEVWAAHQATGARLLSEIREAREELPDGYAFRFPASAFALVAAFVENERRCCPFFTFRVDVPPAAASITLHITGSPEAKAIITAALLGA